MSISTTFQALSGLKKRPRCSRGRDAWEETPSRSAGTVPQATLRMVANLPHAGKKFDIVKTKSDNESTSPEGAARCNSLVHKGITRLPSIVA